MKNYEKKAEYFYNRYYNVKKKMRRNRNQFTKQEQVEISFLQKTINDYGFQFFPEVYIKDSIILLEDMVKAKENTND